MERRSILLALYWSSLLLNFSSVASWKGIPYAQPPVGSLRFMPPVALTSQNSSVIDVTTDALRCVQFAGAPYGVINANIVGSRAGPGQEDCLKLWIWKPANVSSGAMLPVMFYIHVSSITDIICTLRSNSCLSTGWRIAIQCCSEQ